MVTYIMLSTLTGGDCEGLRDRYTKIGEVNAEVEALGARVVAQWALIGPYDLANVVEAPDTETIARISLTLSARGEAPFLTMPAMPLHCSD